jgi:hypothetical protein
MLPGGWWHIKCMMGMQFELTTSNLTQGWTDHPSLKLRDSLERQVISVGAWVIFVFLVATAFPPRICCMLAVCPYPKREWVELQHRHDMNFCGLTGKHGGCFVL